MNPKIKIEIENFFKKQRLIKYKKGQIIVRPGDDLGKIILEKKGYARVYKTTSEGKEISWPSLKPLWIYSISSYLLKEENEYYAESVTDLEAWVAPIDEFTKFLKDKLIIHPEIYREIIGDLLKLLEKTETIIFAEAYNKVAILIKDLVDKFGENIGSEKMIGFNIPHRVISSIVGLTRETVTIQILKMQNQGILENRGRNIVIKDMKKLEELVQI